MNKENKTPLWIKIILGVIVVVFIIGTLGLFIKNDEEDENKKIEKEKKPIKDIEANSNPITDQNIKLNKVNSQIIELEEKISSSKNTERKTLIGSRIAIAIIILIVNGLYFYEYNLVNFSIGNQLNINAALTTIYAFIGFTFYGTPVNFVKSLKRKVTSSWRKKRILLLTELKQLYKEKKAIEIILNGENNNLISE